jgi:ribosomal protein L29
MFSLLLLFIGSTELLTIASIRYVLYKERNMLLTEKNLSRRKNLVFPQPERWKKVKRSMAAIKVVLGERKREKIAAHQEKMTTEREAEE